MKRLYCLMMALSAVWFARPASAEEIVIARSSSFWVIPSDTRGRALFSSLTDLLPSTTIVRGPVTV
jgi:hypothetical protein